MPGKLLCVLEGGLLVHPQTLFAGLGYEVVLETSSRRAMGRLKRWQPDVVVADFRRRHFHDRVSNLESLLALATRHTATRIVILYEPVHAADVALLKLRYRIDAALALPLSGPALQAAVAGST
jgi:hypothetical protein